MRSLAIILFLLWTTPLSAQNYNPPCVKEINALAKRLEVKATDKPSLLVVQSCDGRSYDIVAILNAFIDRMDRHEKKMRK